jgi:hypothetical protein
MTSKKIEDGFQTFWIGDCAKCGGPKDDGDKKKNCQPCRQAAKSRGQAANGRNQLVPAWVPSFMRKFLGTAYTSLRR